METSFLPENPVERLIRQFSKMPGLGQRSARRVVLHLLQKREVLLVPLMASLSEVAQSIRQCGECGNFDVTDPCAICRDRQRDESLLCVVEEVADLWALERAGIYRGHYHVLGGRLSALDGIGPGQLRIDSLVSRAKAPGRREIILALGATIDGQTTAHYIFDRLEHSGVTVTRLAQGVPMGGELDHLDDGTLTAALMARRAM